MKENYTHIVTVFDRSGSMAGIVNDAVGGYNAFMEEQKKVEGEATASLYKFDTEYDTVFENKNLQDFEPITVEDVQPRGGTALLDAIGRTIVWTGEYLRSLDEDQRPDKVFVVVQTDGEENSSKEFRAQEIKEMIKEQEEVYNWEFVFMGASKESIEQAASFGFKTGSSIQYAAAGAGTSNTFTSTSGKIGAMRSMKSADYVNHKAMLNAGVVDLYDDQDREDAQKTESIS